MTRRAIIIVWLAFLCAALWIVVQTRYTADMSAFLPQGATSNQRLLVAQLRDGVTSKVLLIGVADAPPEALARVSRALAARLRNDPQFALVANGELSMAPAERDFVFRNRYLLSAVMTPQHFSVESLRAALQENLALLAGDSGLLLKRLLPADPTGETLRMAESLVGGDALRREQGVWFSQDAREALLLPMRSGRCCARWTQVSRGPGTRQTRLRRRWNTPVPPSSPCMRAAPSRAMPPGSPQPRPRWWHCSCGGPIVPRACWRSPSCRWRAAPWQVSPR
jgi:predicted exporter